MKLEKFDLDYEPSIWHIRCAYPIDNLFVGRVDYSGYVYCDYIDSCSGAFLACIII